MFFFPEKNFDNGTSEKIYAKKGNHHAQLS